MAEAAAKLSPPQNSKIEKLAEAIEIMVQGAVTSTAKLRDDPPSAMVVKFIDDARAGLRTALREFLVPALQLVEGGARQPYTEDRNNTAFTPLEDRVQCGACHRHFICADPHCPNWAAAVKLSIRKPAPTDDYDGDNAE